ncbi:MAG: GNAT family protein [Jatrophihabitantaceae bacterium]
MTADLSAVSWPVRCQRLSIRPATLEDAEATWLYRRLPSVEQWMTARSPDLDVYRTRFMDPERLAKTLVIELDAVVIGDLMLAIEDAWAQSEVQDKARGVQAELGWCLSPEHQGHGYATEAVAELLRICFDDIGLRRVRADCFTDNTASWHLMERVHLRRELHAVREARHRSGQWLDSFGYALLADEWRARHEHTHQQHGGVVRARSPE